MKRVTPCLCLLVSGYLISAVTLRLAADALRDHWSQWRGADGSGVSAEAGLPMVWSPQSARWKTALPGRGHSLPIVWNNRVFLNWEAISNGRSRVDGHTSGSDFSCGLAARVP